MNNRSEILVKESTKLRRILDRLNEIATRVGAESDPEEDDEYVYAATILVTRDLGKAIFYAAEAKIHLDQLQRQVTRLSERS